LKSSAGWAKVATTQGRIAMAGGIVLVIAVMLLVTQLMLQGSSGAWPNITIASELNVPADRVFSDWSILDKPIHFLLFDTQLWIILVFAAALTYWVTDWTSEKLGVAAKVAPPPEPQHEKSELADSGTSP
jgi:hypothetical protein